MPTPDLTDPSQGPTTREVAGRTYVEADVQPLDVDGTRTVAVGTLLFLVGFLVLLPLHGRLEDAGRGWWLWTCLAGFGLGVVGWAYCRHRSRPSREDRRGARG